LQIIHLKKFAHFRARLGHLNPTMALNKIILFEEFYEIPRSIAFSFFADYWRQKGFRLVSYSVLPQTSFFLKIKKNISKLFLINHQNFFIFRFSRLIGIHYNLNPSVENLSKIDFDNISPLIGSNKENILKFRFLNIPVGENFYDWHLRKNKLGTIDSSSDLFRNDLFFFMGLVNWWNVFFQNQSVEAIHVSHSVYLQGMIARVAIFNNIPTYVVSIDKCYRLSKENLHAEGEFQYYDPNSSNFFDYQISYSGAETELVRLKNGEPFISKEHSTISGFKNKNFDFKIDDKANSINALIAAHCFTESVHQNGMMLFPDYLTWAQHLGNLSITSPHKWYIKAHPFFTPEENKIFNQLLVEYPHLTGVPADINIIKLFEEGIDIVFTCYGTIGFDASCMGVPVVMGSQNSAYKNYNFTIQPKNLVEFNNIVNSLPEILKNHRIDYKQILHYFSIHHLRQTITWLFGDSLQCIIDDMGRYENIFQDPKILSLWVEKVWNPELQSALESKVKLFLEGDRYFIDGFFK
jgi:hypothetical protein